MTVDEVLSDEQMEELVAKVLLSKNSADYFEEVKSLTIFQQVQLIESLPAEQRLSIWPCIDAEDWWSLIGYLQ